MFQYGTHDAMFVLDDQTGTISTKACLGTGKEAISWYFFQTCLTYPVSKFIYSEIPTCLQESTER